MRVLKEVSPNSDSGLNGLMLGSTPARKSEILGSNQGLNAKVIA